MTVSESVRTALAVTFGMVVGTARCYAARYRAVFSVRDLRWTPRGMVCRVLWADMTTIGRTRRVRARLVATIDRFRSKVWVKTVRLRTLQMTDGMVVRPRTPTLMNCANCEIGPVHLLRQIVFTNLIGSVNSVANLTIYSALATVDRVLDCLGSWTEGTPAYSAEPRCG